MNLYLVRHGDAADPNVDPQRPLTKLGRRQAKRLSQFLRPLKIRVHAIWHSGLPRAAQTAEIVAKALRAEDGIVTHPGLEPMDAIPPIAREIEKAKADLMIVGHEPFLSKLATRLVSGSAGRPILDLKKGGIVHLRKSDGAWQILWALPPRLLPGAASRSG